jgi:hypothetical protein
MSSVYHRGKFYNISPVEDDGSKSMEELFLESHRQIIKALFCKHDIDSSSGNPTPSSESIIPDSSRPSLTPVEGSGSVLEDVDISLNDSISTEIVEDKPSDPLEPALKDSLPDFVKNDFDTAEECELPPIGNPNDHDEIFSDSDDDDSISCGEIDYVDEEPLELVSLEDNDEEVDTEIQDEALRETLLNVNLLISRIEALNSPISSPILDMDSDSLPELEIFRFEETSSGNPTTHADISLPDYECFHFDIDSVLISDNPLRDPLLEDVDLFLVADDSIPPGIENDENDISFDSSSSRPPAKPPDEVFKSGTNKVIFIMVDEVFELKIAFIIRVFQPFFSYPTISSFHSTGSEDTIFDPGILCAMWPFYLLSPRTN